jgi:hypothetical protein
MKGPVYVGTISGWPVRLASQMGKVSEGSGVWMFPWKGALCDTVWWRSWSWRWKCDDLENVRKHLFSDTVSHLRGCEASARLLCEPQIVQVTGCFSFFGNDTPLYCEIGDSEVCVHCSHMCHFPTVIFHLLHSAKVHPYKQCVKILIVSFCRLFFSLIQNSWSCPAVFQKWFCPRQKSWNCYLFVMCSDSHFCAMVIST